MFYEDPLKDLNLLDGGVYEHKPSFLIEDAKKYLSFEKDKNELEKILVDETSDSELLKMAEIELKDLEMHYKKNEVVKYVDVQMVVCHISIFILGIHVQIFPLQKCCFCFHFNLLV